MIASAVLLGGGLLALRFPAAQEKPSSAVTSLAVVEGNAHGSSSTNIAGQTTFAASVGGGTHFEPAESFFNRADVPGRTSSGDMASPSDLVSLSDSSHSWSRTGLSTPDSSPTGSHAPPDAGNHFSPNERSSDASTELSALTYGNIPLGTPSQNGQAAHGQPPSQGRSQVAETDTASQAPPYVPFRTTRPLSMPEPNPAFFSEPPSPPSLAESTQMSLGLPSVDTPIASPSDAMPFISARPVASSAAMVAEPVMAQPVVSQPVAVPLLLPATASYPPQTPENPRQSEVIYGPARAVILPR